jgi:hypothetical protein
VSEYAKLVHQKPFCIRFKVFCFKHYVSYNCKWALFLIKFAKKKFTLQSKKQKVWTVGNKSNNFFFEIE